MGYIYMICSMTANAIKGFCGKVLSNDTSSLKAGATVSLLRMTMCVIIGFFIVAFNDIGGFNAPRNLLLSSCLGGVGTALFIISWLFCVRRDSYVLVDIFLMMGVIVPVALCRIIFKEPIEPNQYVGFLLLIIAAFILSSYSTKERTKLTFSSFLLLAFCGLSCGLSDFSYKMFVYIVPDGNVAVFNFYTYVFASVTILIFFLLSPKDEGASKGVINKKSIFLISIMSVGLFLTSFFKTLAAETVSSIILYPVYSAVSLIMTTLTAGLFFKERITGKVVVGVIVTILSIIIMNVF